MTGVFLALGSPLHPTMRTYPPKAIFLKANKYLDNCESIFNTILTNKMLSIAIQSVLTLTFPILNLSLNKTPASHLDILLLCTHIRLTTTLKRRLVADYQLYMRVGSKTQPLGSFGYDSVAGTTNPKRRQTWSLWKAALLCL